VRRVRFAEEQVPGGGKQVWHQGEKADLVSLVDGEGRVYEQELTFGAGIVQWRTGEGVRTGAPHGSAAGLREASSLIRYHAAPQLAVLEDAKDLLAQVKGDDHYLRHMYRVIARTLDGIAGSGTHTVTRPRARPPEKPEPPTEERSLLSRLLGLRKK
jgi:hypothetical protein